MLISYFFLSNFLLSFNEGVSNKPLPPNGSHPLKQPNVTRVKKKDQITFNTERYIFECKICFYLKCQWNLVISFNKIVIFISKMSYEI